MKFHPIQTDFTAGIFSPKLWARSNVPQYRQAIKDCKNMVTLRHGPIESRNGTLFIESLGDVYARPFGFQLIPNSGTGEAFFVVASSDGMLRVNNLSGSQVADEELENGDFTNNLEGWTTTSYPGDSSVEWSAGSAKLTPEPSPLGLPCSITQEVAIEAGTENEIREFSFTSSQPSQTIIINITLKVGTTPGSADIGFKTFQTTTGSLSFDTLGNSLIYVTIEAQNGAGAGGNFPYTYRNILSASLGRPSEGVVSFSHPWSQEDIRTLQAEMAPNDNAMYFVTQNVEPHKITYDIATQTWSFIPVAFVDPPSDWVAGNYPTTLGFFQGRSWWGGVQSRPQTFWGSKPNDDSTGGNELEILTIGANANDGLEFTLSQSGRIRWIEGGGNLVIGTTSGEFIVESQAGFIAPDDVLVTQQSADGGSAINSRKVGNMILFVSSDGRKLLGTRYYRDQQQWRSQELSFTAEHLTLNTRINTIAYSRNPESIVWCLLDDGSLIGCTYYPFENMIGWHRHEIGFIQGITTVEKAGVSILGLTVQRVIDGEYVTYVEQLGNDYVDSGVLLETPDLEISVPHLAGETVSVKIDDAQHPDITLDSNGDGMLEYSGQTATIGLPVEAMLETLEPDIGAPGGSSMGFAKRWNEIILRIYGSSYPEINGIRPPVRNVDTPMDVREQNKTQDISVKNIGFNDGSILIEQNLPYLLRITGIFGDAAQNKI